MVKPDDGGEVSPEKVRHGFSLVLEVDPNEVGLGDDFFLLGGHSLMVVLLVRYLASEGIIVRPKDVFDGRTPSRIAKVARHC